MDNPLKWNTVQKSSVQILGAAGKMIKSSSGAQQCATVAFKNAYIQPPYRQLL
jgi:hypothetical protein